MHHQRLIYRQGISRLARPPGGVYSPCRQSLCVAGLLTAAIRHLSRYNETVLKGTEGYAHVPEAVPARRVSLDRVSVYNDCECDSQKGRGDDQQIRERPPAASLSLQSLFTTSLSLP